ncbi:uncharacterized protein LOC130188590 [Pseudoliparis swirei]|uniref:uncharacterized protein LOC130188590 n=1 Tax=Pseudoliparis swirei TaxID=2059687 RepID=UPI0024BED789|nr:uncharacterized protein LOC130188590 [Pseudoliparis swirei]
MKSTITSSFDGEDPEEPMPAVADESPTEVVEKPVPRPRSIFKLKSQCNDDNNTVYCADTSSDAASVEHFPVSEYSSDFKKPRPPRPPLSKSMISRKPRIEAGHPYMTSTSEPSSPTKRTPSPPPPRPQHPPHPAIYSRKSSMNLKSEVRPDEFHFILSKYLRLFF